MISSDSLSVVVGLGLDSQVDVLTGFMSYLVCDCREWYLIRGDCGM